MPGSLVRDLQAYVPPSQTATFILLLDWLADGA
jgi:hypothetical protein